MAEDDAGQRLNLDILHRSPLGFRETTDLDLSKVNVRHVAGRNVVHRSFDFGGAQAEGGRRELVELFGEFTDGRVASRFDVLQR
jgi:hypothetical protein